MEGLSTAELLARINRPERAVVTAGMPYANGPIHLGHLAGAQIPADIYARWLRMLIGGDRVLFVCGTDDHGSTTELAARAANISIREHLDKIHSAQRQTLERYRISLSTYAGTSLPGCGEMQTRLCQDFIRRWHRNGMLVKRVTKQWFDPSLNRFLQDRFVRGRCPNPKCDNNDAYSDTCDTCGTTYDPTALTLPRSQLSSATPILRDTAHWWLDMWKVGEVLRQWIQSKEKVWRHSVYQEVIHTVLPALSFDKAHEDLYKGIKDQLPPHKSKYAAGKRIQAQFVDRAALEEAQRSLAAAGIHATPVDGWAHRAITRDVPWGIPMPPELDPEMRDKTLYVWPDSLIAPIAFSEFALQQAQSDDRVDNYWRNPRAKVYQFLGQDNVFFYTLMQGAMWLGTQDDPLHMPGPRDYQFTEVFGCYHLNIDGAKMSKSRGNFFTGDELLQTRGYDVDQIRYFLALLSLPEKPSNFDFNTFAERNKFLAGPLNAALEKPISACHSKFGGTVPHGTLMDKVAQDSSTIVMRYLRSMERAEYSTLLFAIENYARLINSMFTQYKPHDDRADEAQRRDALFSSFFVLKNLLIMLHPFVPDTMERLRTSLGLDESVYAVANLNTGLPAGHRIGPQGRFFAASNP